MDANFSFKVPIKIAHACVEEMHPMEKGVFIARPDEVVLQCGDGFMTRRQIKHIVERRKADKQSPEEIKEIIDHIPETIMKFDFEVSNSNPKYPDSVVRIKVFKPWERGMVIVMDAPNDGRRAIITAYPYRIMFAYFLLLKKLNASTAGKTPHP